MRKKLPWLLTLITPLKLSDGQKILPGNMKAKQKPVNEKNYNTFMITFIFATRPEIELLLFKEYVLHLFTSDQFCLRFFLKHLTCCKFTWLVFKNFGSKKFLFSNFCKSISVLKVSCGKFLVCLGIVESVVQVKSSATGLKPNLFTHFSVSFCVPWVVLDIANGRIETPWYYCNMYQNVSLKKL